MGDRVRVGVSACLLGEPFRYDGGDRLDRTIRDGLGARFELIPVCPEVELGLGVPREPIGLTGDPARPRLHGLRSGADLTGAMEAWCRRRVHELGAAGICGFVLKARSPSCGVRDVPVATPAGTVGGRGLFVLSIRAGLPDLPAEDDEALRDPAARERFTAAVAAAHRAVAPHA